jgi:hypothetical protein
MGKLGNINIETDLITISKVRCINTKCIYNLVAYPGGWASCNLKHIDVGTDGMCESKQEKQKNESVV